MLRGAMAAVGAALLGLVAAAAALAGGQAPAATAVPAGATTLVITGHGWGHGVGMSQWGAYGYALHGWDAPQILAHYYQGTTLGRHAGQPIRVLLVDGAPAATLASAAPWKLVDGAGTRLRLPAGPLDVPATLKLAGKKLVSPLALTPGKAPVEVGDVAYRGSLEVVSDGQQLQVVNVVGLEPYLEGVVGEEVASTWPKAALEAQAIAARSYAISQVDGVTTGSRFDLYADGRSQMYGGIPAEAPAVTAAVKATAGRVVLYDGKVATTYFSASSGGRTASAEDLVGVAIPYLVSVPDPWDTLSPYHDWSVTIGARAAAKKLGLGGRLVALELQPAASGRIASATATTSAGDVKLTGQQLRDALGLRSSWFELGWMSLAAPPRVTMLGTPVVLSGIATGFGKVKLEAWSAAGWTPVKAVRPDAAGAFTVEVTPDSSTRYRLATGDVGGPGVVVDVRTRP